MGATSSRHSLKYAFSEEEEEALADVCVMYARLGTPFIIPHFILVASYFAKRFRRASFFSDTFARQFIQRHSGLLCLRGGKLTSPTRNTSVMEKKTEEFISLMNRCLERNVLNKNNIVVFDETVIGDSGSLPKVFTVTRKSGGGNATVVQTREDILGCFIPFTLADGTTPFIVFIVKDTPWGTKGGDPILLRPTREMMLRKDKHILLLSSISFSAGIRSFSALSAAVAAAAWLTS